LATALPRRGCKQYRPKQKWSGEVYGVRKKTHQERANDLAAISHRSKPTDRDAL